MHVRKLYISTGAFQGHQGNDQGGHGGNHLCCLNEVAGLALDILKLMFHMFF